MPDVAGYRAKIGVLVPSTNTMVEADFNSLRIPGVTFHAARMHIAQATLESDAAFERVLAQIDGAFEIALRDVLTCEPDHLVMGMSAPTFWGGAAGHQRFLERVKGLTALRMTTGAESIHAALDAVGARRVAVLTPYPAIMRRQIVRYLEDVGFEVVRHCDIACASATAIADVEPGTVHEAIASIDGPDIDAIVQAGTNLSTVAVAAEAEVRLGKPVIANNAASVWRAYRTCGFADRVPTAGVLLRDH